ncbi:hypothetical protein ACLOJK_016611 [Asimina triloba]
MLSGVPASAGKHNMDDCIKFVSLVRERLPPERYALFLKVMKSFKEARINFTTLQSQLVENLFKGHPKLILGITELFGEGIKFSTAAREGTIHTFLDKLKDCDKVLYALFLTMQDDYLNSMETMSISEFCQKVAKLFQGHDDLLKEYESFLCDESEKDPSPRASFGNNLSGISLDERSFDMPFARRTYEGKVLVKFDNTQRKQKREDKQMDCYSNMEKQIKRNRVDSNAKCSKNLTKGSSFEGHLVRDVMVEDTDNKRRSKRLNEGSNRERNNVPEQLDNIGVKESSHSEDSVISSGEDQTSARISESDLSNTDGCTPSYRLLENYPMPRASSMTDRDTSVLNHVVKTVPPSIGGGRGPGPKQSAKDQLDDARFELDVLIGSIEVAIKNGKELLKKVASNQEIKTEDHLSVQNLRCIEQLYGDHCWGILDLIRKNPMRALPMILVRLDQKMVEAKKYRSELNPHTENQIKVAV